MSINRASSVHLLNLTTFFHGKVCAPKDDRLGDISTSILENLVFVHFSNRSGSHYFCELLSNATGIRCFYEALNFDTVKEHSLENNYNTFAEYIYNFLCRKKTIVKITTDQLYMLVKLGFLKPLSSLNVPISPSWISIKRSDVISQAVSFSKALQNQQFTSSQCKQLPDTSVKYDFSIITNIIREYASEMSDFLVISSCLEYSPITVVYEDLLKDPLGIIKRICDRINEKYILTDFVPEFRIQRNELNERFKQKYINDLHLFGSPE